MNESCYFCGKIENLEQHHILPRRYDGSNKDENLVTLCSDCHKKIERLYDKTFYRRIGVEEPKTEYGAVNRETVDKITINNRTTTVPRKGWKIGFNETQLQPMCPECSKPGKIIDVSFTRERDKVYLRFRCDRCSIMGSKEVVSTPKPNPKNYALEKIFGQVEVQECEPSNKVKKNIELEEWYQLGNKMKDLESMVKSIWSCGLPKREVDKFGKLCDDITELRSDLENRFFEEYPDKADLKTFFGDGRKEVVTQDE